MVVISTADSAAAYDSMMYIQKLLRKLSLIATERMYTRHIQTGSELNLRKNESALLMIFYFGTRTTNRPRHYCIDHSSCTIRI